MRILRAISSSDAMRVLVLLHSVGALLGRALRNEEREEEVEELVRDLVVAADEGGTVDTGREETRAGGGLGVKVGVAVRRRWEEGGGVLKQARPGPGVLCCCGVLVVSY